MTNTRVAGCTIVARNYLPYARVLEEGWRRFHDAPFCALVIDDDGTPDGQDGLEVLTPAAVGLPADELARLRGIYGVAELACALKPHLLRHLLNRGAEAVVFLDSDTDVHSDLLGVAELAVRHGVVLSPHVLAPFPLDGLNPSELELEQFGIFNSGFIGVGEAGRAFLDWWESRLRRDCLFCEEWGMHADQKWLDWVPLYFEHHILRDPGVNVGHWNLHERRVGRREDGSYTVNDGPLRCFHYAGFDPERAQAVTSYNWSRPLRVDVAAEPHLRSLLEGYAAQVMAAGYVQGRQTPYGYALSAAGTPLGPWERRVYRELVLAAEGSGREIPDPFDRARSAQFEAMIADPAGAGLLSDAAMSSLEDTRLWQYAPPGRLLSPRRVAEEIRRRLARRARALHHGWMPYPQAGDYTRWEYTSASRRKPAEPDGSR